MEIPITYINSERQIRIRRELSKTQLKALYREFSVYAVLCIATIIIVAYTPLHTVLGDMLYSWKLILNGLGIH